MCLGKVRNITLLFIMAQKTKRVSQRKKVVKQGRNKCNTKTFVTTLKKLSSLHPAQRVQAMKLANDKFIRDFCNNIKKLRHQPVPPNVQKQLHHQSKNLRKLVSAKTSLQTKRKMLCQRGGSGALQRGLLGALAGAITGAFGRP